MTVTDDAGGTASTTTTLEFSGNQAPMASFTHSTNEIDAPFTVDFDASGSVVDPVVRFFQARAKRARRASGLSSISVTKGDVLRLGTVVGGAAGQMYFEIRLENQAEDPLLWLR